MTAHQMPLLRPSITYRPLSEGPLYLNIYRVPSIRDGYLYVSGRAHYSREFANKTMNITMGKAIYRIVVKEKKNPSPHSPY